MKMHYTLDAEEIQRLVMKGLGLLYNTCEFVWDYHDEKDPRLEIFTDYKEGQNGNCGLSGGRT